ncbi:restriction endonuclease subunit S [Acidovorax sp. JMULE5]|uniref:restriction endonuclease subunit S n=1 Tax=Acidovorax sp. JMULE5 TaxID=2518343 RepID=UPI001C40B92B|nr:restriction endonuclease subunit S [Acidovorax sp. JMULE5]QLA81164.1 restriction endonuclease subunit S [Acidovorax sp. JMULE5]
MSFDEVFLEELAAPTKNSVVGGPFGSNLVSKDYVSKGIPVIRGQNMGGRWVGGEFVFVSPEKADSLNPNKARPGDLVFTQRGTLGQVAIVPMSPYSEYIISQSQMKVTLDSTKADVNFLYYAFRSPEQLEYIKNTAIQTGVPHTNLGILKKTPIRIPSLGAQRKIAAVLGSFDDRITLLRETNATLEAIAQALFKSWFVDFDPVRAKMEGRAPEGMDEASAALFPDALEESELGWVPKGWRNVSLKEAVSIHDSKRVPLSGQEREKRRGPYPYYGAAALMDTVDDYLFDGVFLLTGEDGSVADTNGYPIMQYVWGKFWVNNHAHILQGKDGVATEHVMLAMQRTNITPYITGAVQAKLSQTNMWRINFLKPTREVAEHFAALLEPLFVRFRHNAEQAQTLSALRDTLLPRLISGQLRLPEAQAATEAAVGGALQA